MSTATLDRLIVLPITDPIVVPSPSERIICYICGEVGLIVCEQFEEEDDLCICEVCLHAGKLPVGMKECNCPACSALMQNAQAR